MYRDKSVHREEMELLKIIYLLLSASYTPGGLLTDMHSKLFWAIHFSLLPNGFTKLIGFLLFWITQKTRESL